MMFTSMQSSFLRTDDLATTARPWHWKQYWNYPRSTSLQRLAVEDRQVLHPKCSLFTGDSGDGKSTAARIRGMIASCEVLAKTPRPDWKHLERIPCGDCRGCRQVHINEGIKRDGYFEINGSDRHAGDHLDSALSQVYGRKGHGSDDLPYVVALHEVVDLPESAIKMLKHATENANRAEFILLVRNPELKAIPSPLLNRCAGATYKFVSPTPQEACEGLSLLLNELGVTMDQDAVQYLVRHFKANPRACLSALNRTRPFWPQVSLQEVEGLLAD